MCGEMRFARLEVIGSHVKNHNPQPLTHKHRRSRLNGDDEAVHNGDDDGESGADLELFRQLVAIPPKKCLRPACRVDVTVRCRHVKTARTKLESSAAAAVIGTMELVPHRTAQRE